MTPEMILPLILTALVGATWANPTGAPLQSCEDMTPQHNQGQPEPLVCPYFTIPQQLEVPQGGQLILNLTSSDGIQQFRGFLVMAFNISDQQDFNDPIGTFSNGMDSQTLGCFGRPRSAVTHADSSDKSSVLVTWNAPSDFTGFIVFKTTFVRALSSVWVREDSNIVRVLAP